MTKTKITKAGTTTKEATKVTDNERITIAAFVLLTTVLVVILPIVAIIITATIGNPLPVVILMIIWGAAEAFQLLVLYNTYDIPVRTIKRKIKAVKKEIDSLKNKDEE